MPGYRRSRWGAPRGMAVSTTVFKPSRYTFPVTSFMSASPPVTIEYPVGGQEYCAVKGKAAICVSSRRYRIGDRKRPPSLVWNQQVSVKPNGQNWPFRKEYASLHAPARPPPSCLSMRALPESRRKCKGLSQLRLMMRLRRVGLRFERSSNGRTGKGWEFSHAATCLAAVCLKCEIECDPLGNWPWSMVTNTNSPH